MKTCSRCLTEKPLADFGRHSQTRDGLKSRCRECNAAEARAYSAANVEKVKASRATAYAANPEKVKARTRAYFRANRESALAARKRYRDGNPEVAKRSNRKRRALKNGCEGTLSLGIERKLLERQRYRCVNCRADLRKSGHHLDHIKPISKGGRNEDSNVQLPCPPCNLSKHAKDPIDWAQENGRLL